MVPYWVRRWRILCATNSPNYKPLFSKLASFRCLCNYAVQSSRHFTAQLSKGDRSDIQRITWDGSTYCDNVYWFVIAIVGKFYHFSHDSKSTSTSWRISTSEISASISSQIKAHLQKWNSWQLQHYNRNVNTSSLSQPIIWATYAITDGT